MATGTPMTRARSTPAAIVARTAIAVRPGTARRGMALFTRLLHAPGRDSPDHFGEELVRRASLEQLVRRDLDAVPQRRQRNALHIVRRHVPPAVAHLPHPRPTH